MSILAGNTVFRAHKRYLREGTVFRLKNLQLRPFFWRAPHMESVEVKFIQQRRNLSMLDSI